MSDSHTPLSPPWLVQQWWRLRPGRMESGTLTIGLSRLRHSSAAAFRMVCADDLEAASIAVRKGWLEAEVVAVSSDQEKRLAADWGGITAEGVERKLESVRALAAQPRLGPGLANASMSLLRLALTKYAPHHLSLLPLAATEGGE